MTEQEKTKEEPHSTAWYDLRIKALEDQLSVANDTIAKANEELAEVNKGRREVAIDNICGKTTFKSEDLVDKSDEEVFAIEAAMDRMKYPAKGARVGSLESDAKLDSGLTAGRWNAETRKWEA